MEKLNELVELAKKATPGKWWIDSHGHSMVAFSGEAGDVEIVFATDNDMGPLVRHCDTGNLSHWRNDNDATFIAAANPDTILAIAEAFRALEQRASNLNDGWLNAIAERDEEKAKLAELEKQEPRYFYREHNSYNGMKTDWTEVSAEQLEHLKEIVDLDTAEIIEVYTRPAPAADLADLVPVAIPKNVFNVIYDECGGFVDTNANAQHIWEYCRAAILHNIEEAK